LSDRVLVVAGVTVTISRVILVNCSSYRPLAFFTMEAGAKVVLEDSLIYPVSTGL
jgi:hypothetical protein